MRYARRLLPALAVMLLGGAMVLLLVVAPLAIDPSYSRVANTTSEAAAQHVAGAWVARTGFVLLGLGAGIVGWRAQNWPRTAQVAHGLFAAGMVATALFPTRPWFGGPYNHTLDVLHSVAATTVGFSFTLGVAVLVWHRRLDHPWADLGAAVVATVLPVAMTAFPDADGALQRLMFVVAAAWYVREAVKGGANPAVLSSGRDGSER